MRTLEPYITFKNETREALNFYATILGGKTRFMSYGDSGHPTDPAYANQIMHGLMKTDDFALMAADSYPGMNPECEHTGDITLTLAIENLSEGERIFKALSEGGKITMPFEESFFADGFGSLIDKYQIRWHIIVGSKSGF
jgi:PhnB protein